MSFCRALLLILDFILRSFLNDKFDRVVTFIVVAYQSMS